MRLIPLLFALAACGKGDEHTGHTGATGPTTGPTTTPPTTTDGESPVITSGTIDCTNTGGSSKVDTWYANLTATDPQGADTIVGFGNTLTAYQVANDAEAYSDISIVCGDDGACFGSVSSDVSSIPCGNGDSFYWVVAVLDIEGHWSEPFTLTPI